MKSSSPWFWKFWIKILSVEKFIQMACRMIKPDEFDTLIPNLMVPVPGKAENNKFPKKKLISWGVPPSMKYEKWLENDLPDGPHA